MVPQRMNSLALARLKSEDQYRHLKLVQRRKDPYLWIDGKRLISFASNDYLGLAQEPRLIKAAIYALKREGVGASGSRLLSGHYDLHEELERALAVWMGSETSLVFPTGYMANLGHLTALAGPKDLILSDELNHASLIDACRLTKAKVVVVPHRNVEWAAKYLRSSKKHRNVFLVTESIFSMDGDVAPLVDWNRLAVRHQAQLIVDEAHGLGVMGKRGRGVIEAMGLPRKNLIVMGTLSKAFGVMGGAVFCPRSVKEWMVNVSRPFIYTTAMAPALAAAALAALPLVEAEERRKRLWASVHQLRAGFHGLGIDTRDSMSPIVPMVVGDSKKTMKLAQQLWMKGIFAPGIRPPTVPMGTSRLRFSVTAHHTSQHIDRLLSVLNKIL